MYVYIYSMTFSGLGTIILSSSGPPSTAVLGSGTLNASLNTGLRDFSTVAVRSQCRPWIEGRQRQTETDRDRQRQTETDRGVRYIYTRTHVHAHARTYTYTRRARERGRDRERERDLREVIVCVLLFRDRQRGKGAWLTDPKHTERVGGAAFVCSDDVCTALPGEKHRHALVRFVWRKSGKFKRTSIVTISRAPAAGAVGIPSISSSSSVSVSV